MHRGFLAFFFAITFLGSALQAQAQFSIRAASTEPVNGWDRKELGNRVIWVSPTANLTSEDIANAGQTTDANGHRAVGVSFNDAGAKKIRALSIAQRDKLIAVVLDGDVIFAPVVRSEIGNQALITGNGPNGLTAAVVDRLLKSVNRQ
jgi:preprotein translocase subunit SecD